MMDLDKLAKYYFNISNIPVALYREGEQRGEFCRKRFSPNMAYVFLQPLLQGDGGGDSRHDGIDLTITSQSLMCGYVREKATGDMLVVGPVTEMPCLKKNAYEITKAMGEKRSRADEIMEFFDYVPTMPLTTFTKHLIFLNYLVNQEEVSEDLMEYRLEEILGKERDIRDQDRRNFHNTREYDRQLEACVEYGKVEELEVFMQTLGREGKMGVAAEDSLRSFKNVSISAVALIARAAARGGLNYEKALTMSDEYAREIETLWSVDEVNSCLYRAFFDYTSRVAKVRQLKGESALMCSVADYVQEHLGEPLRVRDIAEHVNRNESYLCRFFKKNTGRTLVSYINECKMEEAKRRLKYTSDPVVEIALDLGYSSQAYFTTLFGKTVGMSPAEYREKNP